MLSFPLPEYLASLEYIVNIDSGVQNPEGAGAIAAFFAERYKRLGLAVKTFYPAPGAGPCLEIRNKPETEQIDVLFLGHIDTVFPSGTAAARPFRIEDNRAFGPGVFDMKAGLLSIYYTIETLLADKTALSFCVAYNSDEEVSSPNSRDWLCGLGRKSAYGLVFESGRRNSGFVTRRKGVAKFRLDFHGLSSHAGVAPEKGASAVLELCRWILELDRLNSPEAGTSLNAGLVSGGMAVNVIAAHAWCELDTRFVAVEELERIKQKIAELSRAPFDPRVSVTSALSGFRPPMIPGAKTAALMRLFEECAETVGIPLHWISTGGGSDGNLVAAEGCAVIDSLGPAGDKAHCDVEFVLIDTIEPRLRLLTGVLNALHRIL